MSDEAREICREQCAYMGEPPCWQADDEDGSEFRPCDACTPFIAYHIAALQSARNEALEEAAVRAEEHIIPGHSVVGPTVKTIATAIRNLKE